MGPHTSNMLRSCNKILTYTSRISASVVGTGIPMESKGYGSIRGLRAVTLPFLRPVFPPVKILLAFFSRSCRISNESFTVFWDAWRLQGNLAVGGYSKEGSEDENLWTSRIPRALIFGFVDVGNPATTRFENLAYAPTSITTRNNDESW